MSCESPVRKCWLGVQSDIQVPEGRRASGTRIVFRAPTQDFRAGLSCVAPPVLIPSYVSGDAGTRPRSKTGYLPDRVNVLPPAELPALVCEDVEAFHRRCATRRGHAPSGNRKPACDGNGNRHAQRT